MNPIQGPALEQAGFNKCLGPRVRITKSLKDFPLSRYAMNGANAPITKEKQVFVPAILRHLEVCGFGVGIFHAGSVKSFRQGFPAGEAVSHVFNIDLRTITPKSELIGGRSRTGSLRICATLSATMDGVGGGMALVLRRRFFISGPHPASR